MDTSGNNNRNCQRKSWTSAFAANVLPKSDPSCNRTTGESKFWNTKRVWSVDQIRKEGLIDPEIRGNAFWGKGTSDLGGSSRRGGSKYLKDVDQRREEFQP